MAKVPAELHQAFYQLLDQTAPNHAAEYRERLDDTLRLLASPGKADLREVLRVLETAWKDKSAYLREEEARRQERERYGKQRRGQKGIAKYLPLLDESLPPTDPNRPLVDAILNSSSTLGDIVGNSSPALGPLRLERRGNPSMPWIEAARLGLRQAGVSDEETREDLLSILCFKRKDSRR